MTDTVAMNDRIGELCRQFRLPTMGTQSVARFTAARHGDALSTRFAQRIFFNSDSLCKTS